MSVTGQSFDDFVDEHLGPEESSEARLFSSVVCSATPGTPVVFVSPEFEAHTGYSAEESIGKSLSFLQGPATEEAAVEAFRRIIQSGSAGTVRITNYRKDGQPFLHECELRPIRSKDGALTHFVAVQRMVS